MPYAITHSCAMDGPQFLQALLDLRGLNPNSMAKKAGNHALQSTVARFLSGNQSRRSTMQPVADFFGVDVGGFYDPDKAIEISSDNATVKTVDVLNGDHRIDILGRVVWCWNGRKL